MKSLLLGLLLAVVAHAQSPANMQVEHLANPVGIDDANPQFSWQLAGDQPGVSQSAWQVLVATSTDLLSPDKADLWDSGKSDESSTLVRYAGKTITLAIAQASALGIYELHINGKRVGDTLFLPGWTDYPSFRTLNFVGDQPLEQMLERFRRDLLSRSAEDYRNGSGAMTNLTEGLSRLRENAVQLARTDARDVISRFGQQGGRRLAAVS